MAQENTIQKLIIHHGEREIALPINCSPVTGIYGDPESGVANVLHSMRFLKGITTCQTIADGAVDIPYYTHESSFGATVIFRHYAARDIQNLHVCRNVQDVYCKYTALAAFNVKKAVLSLTNEYLALVDETESAIAEYIKRVNSRYGQKLRYNCMTRLQHLPLDHTVLSLQTYNSDYKGIPVTQYVRQVLSDWTIYNWDNIQPCMSIRDVNDIGQQGQYLPAYLHKLRTHHFDQYQLFVEMCSSCVPTLKNVTTEINPKLGEIAVTATTRTNYTMPLRYLAKDTVQAMAWCAAMVNPWKTSLMAFAIPDWIDRDTVEHYMQQGKRPKRPMIFTTKRSPSQWNMPIFQFPTMEVRV